MFSQKLKEHSTDKIQAAIAKALSELTGEELECSIQHLDFDNVFKVKMQLTLGHPIKDMLNKPKS